MLVKTRGHEVVFSGSGTYPYRTVCYIARTAKRIVHLFRTFQDELTLVYSGNRG
jgi:hypothetical protein